MNLGGRVQKKTVLGLAAMAAMLGGGLRAFNTFGAGLGLDDTILQLLYFLTDVFLVLGASGLYAATMEKTGAAGLTGFVIFVVGILLVRSGTLSILGDGGYRLGASIALAGISLLALAFLKGRVQIPASAFWLAALAAGIAGTTGFHPMFASIGAGLLFGLGFVVAGRELAHTEQ
jgi:hypothetical protein